MKEKYKVIIKKTDNIINKLGNSRFIKKRKLLQIPNKFDNYLHFITFLNKYVKTYHKHSSVVSKIENKENSKSQKKKKVKKTNNRQMPKFYYDKKNKIGRIQFFHFYGWGKEVKKEENKLINITQKKIKEWYKKNINGIIIDLSKHYGGNMWPAVEGLDEILGNTTLLAWGNEKTKKNDKTWINRKHSKTHWMTEFMTNKLKFTKPIAVIVSNKTASSGEVIASIFIGRKNTKMFGKNTNKTAGYFSSNTTDKDTEINNDLTLALTTNFVTTVDGKFHINEVIYVDKKTSTSITDAKKWIIKNM